MLDRRRWGPMTKWEKKWRREIKAMDIGTILRCGGSNRLNPRRKISDNNHNWHCSLNWLLFVFFDEVYCTGPILNSVQNNIHLPGIVWTLIISCYFQEWRQPICSSWTQRNKFSTSFYRSVGIQEYLLSDVEVEFWIAQIFEEQQNEIWHFFL